MSQSIALLDPTPATDIAPPPAFHIMLKPRGAICNLDCHYCYFLSKESMYPDSEFRMSESMLEEYTRQYIEAQQVPEVTFAWQGGEPTLMGLDYFKKAVEFQQKHKKPGMQRRKRAPDQWYAARRRMVRLSAPQRLPDRAEYGRPPRTPRLLPRR